jgi:hypothetical protein
MKTGQPLSGISDLLYQMPRERVLELEVADGIREVSLGAYKKTSNEAETDWFDRNRLGTEPYARRCGRTAGSTPPSTRLFPSVIIKFQMNLWLKIGR